MMKRNIGDDLSLSVDPIRRMPWRIYEDNSISRNYQI